MKISVVGAGGFVGRAVTDRLVRDGHDVVPVVRTARGIAGERSIEDLATADWPALLQGIEGIVHLAARVHVMNDTAADPLAEFRRVNTEGTVALAKAAASAGVKRFVFISSIKVSGEDSPPGRPLKADDEPAPVDPYGISKLEAERALFDLGQQTGMAVTVIRPTLVHGPGVRANFETLVKLVRSGLPLPLGSVRDNRRSVVGLDNLADLVATCLVHPAAPGQVFMATDGEDVSTRGLIERIAAAMGRKARLVPVPTGPIAIAARLLGKGAAADRILGSLQADIGKNRELLGWSPPVSLDEGLRRTVAR